jgi:hypothetical protein
MLVVRLKLKDGRIAEAEQFVVRDPLGAQRYEEMGEPDPVWLEAIPQQSRQTHEALEAAAWMYFQTLEKNDGAGIYPFTEDCQRLEHARPAANTKTNEEYGHAETGVEFTTLKVRDQYSLGMMGFISRIRDRRALVTDTERGAVLGSCVFDFDATLERIHFANGSDFVIPKYFRTPRSHQMNEAFKILNGAYRYIEMTLLEVPHGTRPVWTKQPTTRMDYARTAPLLPPVKTDRAALLDLVDKTVEALIRCCPCDLPFAQGAVYTENGVRLAPGEGLWKTISGRGAYRIALADAATGQAAYYGDIDEHGQFGVLALRLKVVDGRIAEMELVIARPERWADPTQMGEATSAMFIALLLADLDAKAFAAPNPALLSAPAKKTSRADLLGAVERYFEGFAAKSSAKVPFAEGCTRRENGVPASNNPNGPRVDPEHPGFGVFAAGCADQLDAGYVAALSAVRRRPLVVDEEAGLVFDLALFDHAAPIAPVSVKGAGDIAVAASFREPSTDIHAQLFKIDGGRIVAIEDIVRRVAYGQASPWDKPLHP